MGFGDYIIVTLGAVLFVGGLLPVITSIALRKFGRRTRGTVVGFDSYFDSSGTPFRTSVIEYSEAGKRFQVKGRWSTGGSLSVGDERTVYYWPRAPHRGYTGDAISWAGPLVVSLSGVVLAWTALEFPFL